MLVCKGLGAALRDLEESDRVSSRYNTQEPPKAEMDWDSAYLFPESDTGDEFEEMFEGYWIWARPTVGLSWEEGLEN